MGRIQSTVGLISGIDYGQIIDSLISFDQQPIDLLTSRNAALKQEQVAVTQLSADLLTVKYDSDNLAKSDVFQKTSATSGNDAALGATVTGTPTQGTYQFTPVQTAQQQQFLSSGFTSETAPLGGGAVTIRFGDNVQRSAGLDVLNGGNGIQRGMIRITDRAGDSAQIDLSAAQTIDDVLDAINNAAGINVTASVDGGKIRLTDNTGQTVSDLKVQEVGRGTTAASLGLAGIDTASSVAEGSDLLTLTADTPLGALNDGRGVQVSTVLPDISYTLQDGTTGSIDFSPLGATGDKPQQETTVGDILNVINAVAPGKLKAAISADGKRLVVTDLTSGSGSFTLQSAYSSPALAALGLDNAAVGGVITGSAIIGGLKTVLLSSLNGGKGLGKLGKLQLTNRNGASTTVDLSGAETLEDVVDTINAANAGITAAVNDAKNGIVLTDTTGGATSPMIVADADSSDTAAALGIAANTNQGVVNSGDLHLQVVSANTQLSGFNGGAGVALGKFTITATNGHTTQIDLAQSKAQTIGDVIKLINQSTSDVLARINDTGDGILLTDLAHGSGTLQVADVNSTTASDLHLTRGAVVGSSGGLPTATIDGSITQTIQLAPGDTLDDLENKIAAANPGVTASTYNDGSSRPHHLALTSQHSGRVGQFVVDTSGVPALALTETARARDALLVAGSGGSGSGILLASSTNQFQAALPGVTLQVKQPSATPVAVTVASSDTDLVAAVQAMVSDYNKFRQQLNTDTAYDPTQNQKAVLFGDSAALSLDTGLSQLLTSRISDTGSVQSLGDLGISLQNDGTLAFDQNALEAKFAADPQDVQNFFTAKDTGFSAQFSALVEQMCGQDVSLLANRFKSLDTTINDNQAKIDAMTQRLDNQRQLLTTQFMNTEMAIAKMQNNLSILDSIMAGQTTSTTTGTTGTSGASSTLSTPSVLSTSGTSSSSNASSSSASSSNSSGS